MRKLFAVALGLVICIYIPLTTNAQLKGLDRLKGVWVVDVRATVSEHEMQTVPYVKKENVTPENLEKERYEFSGNNCTIYRWFAPDGETRKVTVYEEDASSVVILYPPPAWTKRKYPKGRPSLKELIAFNPPLSSFWAIEGLMGFEFTSKNEIRIFRVRLDAKGKPLRQFTGTHLIRKTE